MIRLAAFADETDKSLQGQIAALKRNDLQYIELRGIDGQNIADISETDAKNYAQRLREANIRVWSIGSPIGKIKISDSFAQHKEKLRHVCALAKIFDTDKIRVFSFYEAYEEEEKVISYLREMVELAGEFGCELYHENEKAIFGDTQERVQRILEQVPGLKSVYDPANFIQVGEDPKKTLEALHSRTDYFHIKDAILETDMVVPAGLGDGCIEELVARIPAEKEITLTLEPHLKIFDGYAQLDHTKLKNKYFYANRNEAFDAAVSALKEVLRKAGYQKTKEGYEKL